MSSPEILGPLVDGQLVVIGNFFEDTFRVLNLIQCENENGPENGCPQPGASSTCPSPPPSSVFFMDSNLSSSSTYPIFQIRFAGTNTSSIPPPTTTSLPGTPYVFFTVANALQMFSNVPVSSCLETGYGIGTTTIPLAFGSMLGEANASLMMAGTPMPFLLQTSSVPPICPFTSPRLASWWPDALALSQVTYTMQDILGKTVFAMGDPRLSGSNPQFVATCNFVIIPVTWLTNCTGGTLGTSVGSVQTPFAAICSTACKFQATNVKCTSTQTGALDCTSFPMRGFTDATDCQNGFFYTYCPAGTSCTGTCQSGCPILGEVCTFSSETSTYSCQVPGTTGVNGGAQTSTTVILIGVAIGILVVGVIFYLLYLWVYRHRGK